MRRKTDETISLAGRTGFRLKGAGMRESEITLYAAVSLLPQQTATQMLLASRYAEDYRALWKNCADLFISSPTVCYCESKAYGKSL
jgi:hypothetical protein